LKELAQPHVPDPVLAVGILQPAGTWAAFGVGQALPLVGRLMRRQADEDAGTLAHADATTRTSLFALTDDKLYAFDAKRAGTSWKVGEQAGVWERKDLAVVTAVGKLSTKVVIDVVPTGEHYELEVTTANRGVADAFLSELRRPDAD